MSTLQAGLTTDEINVALIAWYNERTGQKWPIHRIWYRDMGEEIRFAERPLDPLEDLNAMALITGAMTDEEKARYGEMLWDEAAKHDYCGIGGIWEIAFGISTLKPEVLAAKAVMALGLAKAS